MTTISFSKSTNAWKIKTKEYELSNPLGESVLSKSFKIYNESQIYAYKKFIVPSLTQK